jgi:very-short-patch-repair endonuclease
MTSYSSSAARASRRARVAAAERLAEDQCGVLSRRQVYALGISRWQVRAQVEARRWRRTGRQTVATRTGALSVEQRRWVAVLETCPSAALAGVTALQAAGLSSITEDVLHVIAPKSSRPRRAPGVHVHESRRFREVDVLTNGVRRVRVPVAVVQAALWAVSDRQAALFVVTSVQQRLVRVADVAEALTTVRRHKRRRLLLQLVADIADGAQSLGELDLTAALRRRGLPPPTRQVVRQLSGGRVYLDAEWEQYRLRLEIDGAQHEEVEGRLDDACRDLELAADGGGPVRVPLLALRLDEDAVLVRLEAVLRARGWRPPGSAAA